MDFMIWVWLGVFVLAIMIEAMTQELVSIWFSIGAFAALCISQFTPWWVSLIVFIVVSIAALLGTRPVLKKIMRSQVRKTNTDDFVGQRVQTIKDITRFSLGEVKINGIIYNAVLPEGDEEVIKKDDVVEIVALKGNKVVVRKVED